MEVSTPFAIILDSNGQPLEAGYVYIGEVNKNPETSPVAVYWDSTLTIPAAQPLRTSGGYIVRNGTPAKLYTKDIFSITVRDKNRALVYTLANIAGNYSNPSVSILDYGGKADGTTDNYTAFVNAYNALPDTGGIVDFPGVDTNVWRFSQTLNIRKPLHIRGVVGANGSDRGTVLKFDADVSGIVFAAYNTSLYTTITPDGALGSTYSILENVLVISAGGSASVDGVVLRTQVTCRNVVTRGFKRYGFRIYNTIGGGGSIEGDGNQWRLDMCKAILNGSHGLYVDGNDSNTGLCTKFFGQLNGGYGIYENSLIGNTYVGCDLAGNTSGHIWAGRSSAANTFIGCWDDSGGTGVLNETSVAIGGNCFNNTDGLTLAGGAATSRPFIYLNDRGPVKTQAQLGCRSNSAIMTVLGWGSQDMGNDYNISPQFKLNYLNTYGTWALNHLAAYDFMYLPNQLASPRSFGPQFPAGIYFGSNPPLLGATQTTIYRLDYKSAAPTTGTWNAGDRVFNSAPSVGNPKGWIRTVSGTEGTLNGGATTGTIGIGSTTLTVSSATGITRGCWLSVAGAVTKAEVLAVSGTTITLSVAASASVATVAVAYVGGTWVSEGNL